MAELTSSDDIHGCSEEAAISHHQKCSQEELLEDIPEDGHGCRYINIWIQRADLQTLKLFRKELVAMVDQSIHEISSKNGQAQASDPDMHRLLRLAGMVTMLPTSPDLLPAMLRLFMTLKCVRNILHRLCSLPQNGSCQMVASYVMNHVRVVREHDAVLNIVLAQDTGQSDEEWRRVDSFVHYLNAFRTGAASQAGDEVCAVLQQNWIAKHSDQVERLMAARLFLLGCSYIDTVQCYQAYLQKKSAKLQKHARYTPQEIENMLMKLFEG
uniref:Uncharacterized protein n=1 Tax=Oryza brachyantha TaxID=4533 RepID=J3MJE7_ORYBR